MNYITQLNTFYKFLPNNPLSSNAQCLYGFLLNYNNGLGWIKEFTVANTLICGYTNYNRQILDRARNELIQKGYIQYRKGTSNQAGKYLIVEFDTQGNTQDNTQDNTQGNTQNDTRTVPLNKLNKTKQNKESKKDARTFDTIIDDYTENEILRYELKEHLKTRKAKKATLTDRAIELSCENLDKLAQDDDTKIAIVKQSIANGWIGFFALKQTPLQVQYNNPGQMTEEQKMADRERQKKMLQEAIDRGDFDAKHGRHVQGHR